MRQSLRADVLRFSKYEGTGNDFLVLDTRTPDDRPLDVSQVVALCDRHRGVGADGVLLTGAPDGRPFMRVYNADGSQPAMCGNGIRCVALHLVRTQRLQERSFSVATPAGEHACRVLQNGHEGLVEVQMQAPSLQPEAVPVRAKDALVEAPFDVDGERLHVTTLSMGNPHVVTFDDLGDRRRVLGPRIERDPRLPAAANVSFARRRADGGIDLAVWERGVGWTRACGTGACATAVAAVHTGRAERHRRIEVHLPGGTLSIVVGAPGHPVWMTGPARHVFDGEMPQTPSQAAPR